MTKETYIVRYKSILTTLEDDKEPQYLASYPRVVY